MATDDSADGEPAGESEGSDVRKRIERGADRAAEGFDEGVVDVLSWVLDTETRARIYASLRQHPDSTSEEVAERTGLYPSTVREALADLHDDGLVVRHKRENDGAGNNPYEYGAIAPSALVRDAVEDIQEQLNAVVNLDRYLDSEDGAGDPPESGGATDGDREEPVTITVDRDGD